MSAPDGDRFEIEVEKDSLVFCAAHFITYGDGACERLHGHNYRVAVRLSGRLDEHGLVFDFLELRDRMRELVGRLDHRTLLPDSNPWLELERSEGTVTVRHEARAYSFPEEDVAVLPIANTTAELLARWLADRLVEELSGAEGAGRISEVRMEVEESFGQSGAWTRSM